MGHKKEGFYPGLYLYQKVFSPKLFYHPSCLINLKGLVGQHKNTFLHFYGHFSITVSMYLKIHFLDVVINSLIIQIIACHKVPFVGKDTG